MDFSHETIYFLKKVSAVQQCDSKESELWDFLKPFQSPEPPQQPFILVLNAASLVVGGLIGAPNPKPP